LLCSVCKFGGVKVSSVSQSEIEFLKGLKVAGNIGRAINNPATISSLTRLAYAGYIKKKTQTEAASSTLYVISRRGLKALDAATNGDALGSN